MLATAGQTRRRCRVVPHGTRANESRNTRRSAFFGRSTHYESCLRVSWRSIGLSTFRGPSDSVVVSSELDRAWSGRRESSDHVARWYGGFAE